MPVEVAELELIEPLPDIDMPLDELMLVMDMPLDELMLDMADVALVAVDIDGPPPPPELDVGDGPELNPSEMRIPAGTCETLIGETTVTIEAIRLGVMESRLVVPAAPDPVETKIIVGVGAPLPMLTTFMEARACTPCCALASAVRSLRRAECSTRRESRGQIATTERPSGSSRRIDSNKLATSLPALVAAGFWAISAAWALPPGGGEQHPILEVRGPLGKGRDATTLTTTAGLIVRMGQDCLEYAKHGDTSSGSARGLWIPSRPEGRSSADAGLTSRKRILRDPYIRE